MSEPTKTAWVRTRVVSHNNELKQLWRQATPEEKKYAKAVHKPCHHIATYCCPPL